MSFGKIAYLSPALPALSETFVYEEIRALERRGITVVPISVRKPSQPIPDQADLACRSLPLYAIHPLLTLFQSVIYFPQFGLKTLTALRNLFSDMAEVGIFQSMAWKLAFQFLASAKLAHILRRQKCTHLHVHFAHTPTQIAMYSVMLAGIPFTFTAHANDIFAAGLLLPVKARRASHVITISEFNSRHLQSLGIPAENISVVRCGVSFANLPLNHPDNSVISSTGIHIGSLGRLVEKKGFDVLINSVSTLRREGHNIVLHLAGDGPLLGELKTQAMSLGISEFVIFEGPLAHNIVSSWMQRMDMFVLACKADKNGDMDGIPVVLMEAMTQYIPVVSTRLSGIPELVRHNETGLLAAPGDSDSLAMEIKRLLDSPDLRRQLATNAQSFVTQEFSQGVNIDRLLSHFH
jgi:glycosyltransferase involved in cell wall biosynthesis